MGAFFDFGFQMMLVLLQILLAALQRMNHPAHLTGKGQEDEQAFEQQQAKRTEPGDGFCCLQGIHGRFALCW
jgi:hypothetical protein